MAFFMISRRWAHTYPGEWRDIGRWSGGEEAWDPAVLAGWERAFAAFVGMPDAAAINSGRRGMTAILEHFGVGPGDEVIVPAYTLGEILPLIQSMGATVVPADIDPGTLNAGVKDIERRLSPRTKAIIALHVFGVPCDMPGIMALARARGISVIEDCAHAAGTRLAGQHVGTFGDAAFFSFEMNKPINTFGGGMVVSHDPALVERVRRINAGLPCDIEALREKVRTTRMERMMFASGLAFPMLYLLATPRFHDWMSRSYRGAQDVRRSVSRYSSVQARLGLANLPSLEERIRLRDERVRQLRSLVPEDIHFQGVPSDATASWYFAVAVLPSPAAPVRKRLLWHGIDAAVEGEVMDDCAHLLGYADCPVVARVYPRAIAFPMYDGLGPGDVERIAKALKHV